MLLTTLRSNFLDRLKLIFNQFPEFHLIRVQIPLFDVKSTAFPGIHNFPENTLENVFPGKQKVHSSFLTSTWRAAKYFPKI